MSRALIPRAWVVVVRRQAEAKTGLDILHDLPCAPSFITWRGRDWLAARNTFKARIGLVRPPQIAVA